MGPRRQSVPAYRAFWVVALALPVSACATFDPQTVDVRQGPGAIQSGAEHDVSVSTTILSDEHASRLFGVDPGSVGLQSIWLRIENRTHHSHWLAFSALDANYYPPDEAAVLFHPVLSAKDEQAVARYFRSLAIPLKNEPGYVNSGYVLVPRTEGGAA